MCLSCMELLCIFDQNSMYCAFGNMGMLVTSLQASPSARLIRTGKGSSCYKGVQDMVWRVKDNRNLEINGTTKCLAESVTIVDSTSDMQYRRSRKSMPEWHYLDKRSKIYDILLSGIFSSFRINCIVYVKERILRVNDVSCAKSGLSASSNKQ